MSLLGDKATVSLSEIICRTFNPSNKYSGPQHLFAIIRLVSSTLMGCLNLPLSQDWACEVVKTKGAKQQYIQI